MTVTVERKEQDGKLLQVSIEVDDGVITEAQLVGDFFVQPPDGRGALEDALVGNRVEDRDALAETIRRVDAELIGVADETLVDAVQEAGDQA